MDNLVQSSFLCSPRRRRGDQIILQQRQDSLQMEEALQIMVAVVIDQLMEEVNNHQMQDS
jgi:hypothetical protein